MSALTPPSPVGFPVAEVSLVQPAAAPSLWMLNQEVIFLNHGSFGSCPQAVLDAQREWRERLERDPVQFLVRELEPLTDQARAELAKFLGGDAENLVFVPNATHGVNAVLRSLEWKTDDELLVTNHEYNASRNAVNFVAARAGARVVVAEIPFPLQSADEVAQAILARVTARTRLAVLDHVTSQSGLVLPLERLVKELRHRGVETLVDGAHAPGMLPLDLREIGAAYYTGNCHKWICAPKGAAFLYVRPDKQFAIRPLAVSHGANTPRTDRSRFLIEFGWTGTHDPSAYLCVPQAIKFMGQLLPGGWREIMARNRALALRARELLCAALELSPPCPEEMIGSLVSLPITDGSLEPSLSPLYADPLQERLYSEHRIEVPIIPWPAPPHRLLRVSAQLYNSVPQYQRLAEVLRAMHIGGR